MFDIGWAELVIIGVVALIVIGPRDLPDMFRTLGRFTAKLRSMSRDFQRAMESAAKESGVKDVAADLKTMTSPKNLGLDAVKDAASKFEKWDPLKPKAPTLKDATPAAPTAAPPVATAASPVATVAPPAAAQPLGPATQALADKVAAKKLIVAEAAEKLRAVSASPAPLDPSLAPAKAPGRVRSAAKTAGAAATANPTRVAKPKAPASPKPVKSKGE